MERRVHTLHPSVPTGLVAAFYKGTRPGWPGVWNRIGRFLERGPYSHTELVLPSGISCSSSIMDSGVRMKLITYTSGEWDFLPIPDQNDELAHQVRRWYEYYNGAPYDIPGNIRFATGFARDNPDKWFCSESNMDALGFRESYRYGPCGMATILKHTYKTEMVRQDLNNTH